MAEEDYCSEEIRAILKQVEKRMRTAETRKYASQQPLRKPSVQEVPKLAQHMPDSPYIRSNEGLVLVDSRCLFREHEERVAGQLRRVEDPVNMRKRLEEGQRVSTGERWFNLPRTELTPNIKRDLRLMRMRGVLDPKRHYKQDDSKELAPTFSQVATVIQGPTEFLSARLTNKDKKSTFVEEVLAAETASGRAKKTYGGIQAKKTNGKKAFYKKLKERRARSS